MKEKTINSKKIFDGKVVKLFVDEVLTPNNNVATREIVKHLGGVCILGIIDNKVIMEKQYRYAYDEILYELPAGKLEQGERPLEAAKREFEEETGYKIKNIIEYGKMYPTCGYSNEIIYLFLAEGLSKSKRNLDEDEIIDLEFIEIEKVVKMIKDGIIKDAKTICLISKYLMNLPESK